MSPEYTNLTPQEVGHKAANLGVSGNPEALMQFVFWAQQRAFDAIAIADDERIKQEVKLGCSCETCRPLTMTDMRMVLCETCGNKRCPHATNHRNACTDSNEPGQPGSAYEHCLQPTE